jgi:glycerophosphoryl diester phosphodiesterase
VTATLGGARGAMGKVLAFARRGRGDVTAPPAKRWGKQERPLVIGHRGASAHALENTLTAFKLAREHGADGVELDVWRCASGEVVVFHDETLARLGGRDERVTELPLVALRETTLRGGESIPTLDEVLETLGGGALVNVELKTAGGGDGEGLGLGLELGPAVAEVIARHAAAARVIVSSFNPIALARFRVGAPHVATGLLFHAGQAAPLRGAWARHVLRPVAVHPDRHLCARESVARWRREGYAVNVWTVDGEREVKRVAGLGVDGLITNDPGKTRAWLGA